MEEGAATGTAAGRIQPNGGRFDFDDGGTFLGGWEDGKAHGYGVCTGPKGQGAYSGSWHYGFEVSGVYIWPSGSAYEGQWQNGKRHGLGVEARGRWMYRGEWTQGFKGRYGVRQSSTSNAKYEGTWANGLQDGYGSETYADGGTYQGQWLRGMRHGYGVRASAPFGQASHYRPGKALRASLTSLRSEGGGSEAAAAAGERDRRVDDSRGGFVLKARSDEAPQRRQSLVEKSTNIKKNILSKIRKQRSTGDLEKKGVSGGSIRSTGSSASWVSTESSQSGVTSGSLHTDSNASFVVEDEHMDASVTETYLGEWKNDKRSGFGISERSDGLKYEGEWFNNKKYGYGVTTFRDGTKEEGKYKNNLLVTSQKKKHLFLIRSAKFRERIDAAVNAAQRASKIALQKADIAISRTATARGKAEMADTAAEQAREDFEIAQATAKQFAPDFVQPGLEKLRSRSRFKTNSPEEVLTKSSRLGQGLLPKVGSSPSTPTGQGGPPLVGSGVPGTGGLSSPPQPPPGVPPKGQTLLPPQQQPPYDSRTAATALNYQQQNDVRGLPGSRQYDNQRINTPPLNPQQSVYDTRNPQMSPYENRTSSIAQSQYDGRSSNINNPYDPRTTTTAAYSSNQSNYGPSQPPQQQPPTQQTNYPTSATIHNDGYQQQQQQQQQQHGTSDVEQQISNTLQPGNLQHRATIRRNSKQLSGESPSYNFQQAMSDHFDHYKRPPSRDSSVDRYTQRRAGGHSRQPSVDKVEAAATGAAGTGQTALPGSRAPSVPRGSTPLSQARGGTPGPTGNPGVRGSTPSSQRGGTPASGASTGNGSVMGAALGGGGDLELRKRSSGGGQGDFLSGGSSASSQPKRTESLYVTPQRREPTPKSVPIVTNLQRKKSLPDAGGLPKMGDAISREEASVLSSARREELRRMQEESEKYRANPLLYLVSPHVKEWFSRQQLVMLVLFVNISLAIMFFKLLT